jgi:hypothetical protein
LKYLIINNRYNFKDDWSLNCWFDVDDTVSMLPKNLITVNKNSDIITQGLVSIGPYCYTNNGEADDYSLETETPNTYILLSSISNSVMLFKVHDTYCEIVDELFLDFNPNYFNYSDHSNKNKFYIITNRIATITPENTTLTEIHFFEIIDNKIILNKTYYDSLYQYTYMTPFYSDSTLFWAGRIVALGAGTLNRYICILKFDSNNNIQILS